MTKIIKTDQIIIIKYVILKKTKFSLKNEGNVKYHIIFCIKTQITGTHVPKVSCY